MAVLWQAASTAQVWPLVNYSPDASQNLVNSIASGGGSKEEGVFVVDPAADVNFAGAVWMKCRRADVVLKEEAPDEVVFGYEDIRTDASPLFLAAHAGDLQLVRSLIAKGADVNQRVFHGYPITSSTRQNNLSTVYHLIKAGSAQPACEEALIESALQNRARISETLMGSELVRPAVAARALACAAQRGFVEVVDALLKCGADPNAKDRMLLRSLKPSLHTNVDCTALFAAIISRQISVVQKLLQAGVRKDIKVRVGAWSWDQTTGEELRVGAGLSESYDSTWCAVEYYESTGQILCLLLQNTRSINSLHFGRSLLHHAILCGNLGAVETLISVGADLDLPVRTNRKQNEFKAVHLAARIGYCKILEVLVNGGCGVDSRAENGDTPLIFCVRFKKEECLRVLIENGADLGVVNLGGESAALLACSTRWVGFQNAVISSILSGNIPKSSDKNVFSALFFMAQCGDVAALDVILSGSDVDINEHDKDGFTPIMITAREGHVAAFRSLIFAGANVRLCNKNGENAIKFCQSSKKRDLFEQVMLEFAIENGTAGGFYALHCAARRGDVAAVRLLGAKCGDVNLPDSDGYTPLMLAAKEGHAEICEILFSYGAKCDIQTSRGETALSLARECCDNSAEIVIFDEMSRILVLNGGRVKKHTKNGKGKPHYKFLKMKPNWILSWGKSWCRNVICEEVEVGPSLNFVKNRGRKGDSDEPGLFRIVTMKGKEFHFFCEGGKEVAKMWVRGIKLGSQKIDKDC